MKGHLRVLWSSLFLLSSGCILPPDADVEGTGGNPSGGDPAGNAATGGTGGGVPLPGQSGGDSGVLGAGGSDPVVGGTPGGGTEVGTGGATLAGPVAWVYQHCPFDGWSVELTVGDYTAADLIALGASDNNISSIEVADGFEVILYDGDALSGSSTSLTSDSSCLTDRGFNDLTTSIRVQTAMVGGGSGGASSGGATGSGGATSSGGAGSGGSSTGGGTSDDPCRLYYGNTVPVCCTPQGSQRTNVDEVLNLLNAYRNSLGLNSLAVDAALEEAMQGHCMHMDQADFFSHSSPVGAIESPWARAEYCGSSADAENIAAGQQSPASVMDSWKNSSGHDSNMRGKHTVVGIGEYNRNWGQIFR